MLTSVDDLFTIVYIYNAFLLFFFSLFVFRMCFVLNSRVFVILITSVRKVSAFNTVRNENTPLFNSNRTAIISKAFMLRPEI